MKILQRLAAEPAAFGTLLSSVLPALVVMHVIALDAETIGVLVVAVNAISGFAIRMLVAPTATAQATQGAQATAPAAAR